MSENIATNLVTLAAVFVGWFLAEGTSQIRGRLKRRRLIAALVQELEDAENYLRGNIETAQLLVQCLEVNLPTGIGPGPAPQQIFDQHYAEVAPYLRKGERISFFSIHTQLRELNEKCDTICSQAKQIPKDAAEKEKFASQLIGFYVASKVAAQLIVFHKLHRRKIDPWRVDSKDSIQAVLGFQEEIEQVRRDAQALGRGGVAKKFLGR